MDLDGSYHTVHAREVRQTHNLIHIDGRPQYFRQKSVLWDWNDPSDTGAVFEPQYPKGLLIYPPKDHHAVPFLQSDRVQMLKRLAELFQGPIKVSGFANAAEVNEGIEEVSKFLETSRLSVVDKLDLRR